MGTEAAEVSGSSGAILAPLALRSHLQPWAELGGDVRARAVHAAAFCDYGRVSLLTGADVTLHAFSVSKHPVPDLSICSVLSVSRTKWRARGGNDKE